MNSSAIAVSGLRKAYRDKTVLDGVDLEAQAGAVFALLGPNGAGKTTTVNVLTTLLTPHAGKFFGPGKGDSLLSMLEDLADLFEQSAANGTPIRAVVGEDPVELAVAFLRSYPEGQWISRERERLTNAIDRVASNEP